MSDCFEVISPVDGSQYLSRSFATDDQISQTLENARQGLSIWREVPLVERVAICRRAIDMLASRSEQFGEEITWQMGRPLHVSAAEVSVGYHSRAEHFIGLAEDALKDRTFPPEDGVQRYIRHEPLGIVLSFLAWNYPFANASIASLYPLVAGNAVIIKHSPQCPLVAERLVEVFEQAGVPKGALQYLHLSNENSAKLVGSGSINHVEFIGSVEAGKAVLKAGAGALTTFSLELGGKDAGYVRADAEIDKVAREMAAGYSDNSGQSCCSLERIYVHDAVYDSFLEALREHSLKITLGHPIHEQPDIGPVATLSGANVIRGQVEEAVRSGGRALLAEDRFAISGSDKRYIAPQIIADANHTMSIMTKETFGPVAAVMRVTSDDDAVAMINDTRFGLTASVWTQDIEAAQRIGDQVSSGTWLMNRCDHSDINLPWGGTKSSGLGYVCSDLGYYRVTRPRGFHLRTQLPDA